MSEELSVLDKQLALKRSAGNEKLADDLLEMLVNELPNYKTNIKNKLAEGNKEELRQIIHKLHGGLRYVGAPALIAIVSSTDYELFELKNAQLQQNIEQIYFEIDRVLEQKKYSDTAS